MIYILSLIANLYYAGKSFFNVTLGQNYKIYYVRTTRYTTTLDRYY